MYPPSSNSKIIELTHTPPQSDDFPHFDPNTARPLILSYGSQVLLGYNINHFLRGTPIEDMALISFKSGNYRWGSPNEEGLNGHPLLPNGLKTLSIVEVTNSPWVEQIKKMNSMHPRYNPDNYKDLRHFIFAFHDSMFECLARSYSIEKYNGSLEQLESKMKNKIDLSS